MDKNLNLKILSVSDDPIFSQREEGIAHFEYLEETTFYSYVQSGNVEMVEKLLTSFFDKEIVVGRLSKDPLRQAKYWAVCCITLGARSAIKGGLDEMTAYNMSDSYIMAIDEINDAEQIGVFLADIALKLTKMVRERQHSAYTSEIYHLLNYIDVHLHEKLTLSKLSSEVGYSPSYLSKSFKKQVGVTITDYITHKKMEEAKTLLLGKNSQTMIAYYLGFCSQTHFIETFKKYYGVTPMEYKNQVIKPS